MDEKRRDIKKHVATIHCANTLSLLQRKLSNALLYHAYHELLEKETHQITIKRLCLLIGYGGNNHGVIKQALKDLVATVIEWNVIDSKTGEEDWTASSVLASVNLKGSMCTYTYSQHLRELLHSPSIYGRVNMIIQGRFNSSYGLALYENCVRYRGLPQTAWLELDLFRKLMGVPKDSYLVFRDLNRRVLDKSVQEVNTYSDILVTPETRRVGRRVVAIRFLLKAREKKVRLGVQTTDLTRLLTSDFGLTEKQAIEISVKYSHQIIQEKMELIKKSNTYNSGKIKNLAAYLFTALKQDFLQEKPSNNTITPKKQRRDKHEEMEAVQLERQRKVHSEAVAEIIDQTILAFPPECKAQLEREFIEHLGSQRSTWVLSNLKKHGFENKIVRAMYRNFLKKHHSDLFPMLPIPENA